MARPTPADIRAARRWGRLVEPIARGYTNPVNGRPLSGRALLLKVASGESGFNSSADSGKARGRTQFTPGSRAVSIRKFGVDPLRSVDEAYHAAALHLLGKINGRKGLEGYNPGMPSYPDYILGQRIGNPGRAAGAPARAGGSQAAPGVLLDGGGGAAGVPQGSEGMAALLDALGSKPQQPSSMGLQAPAHSAQAPLPGGFQLPASGGGPAPKPDVGALLEAVRTVGGDIPSAGGGGGIPLAPDAADAPPGARGAPAQVAKFVARASKIDGERLPYKWGGGHGPTPAKPGEPLDCSGAVSRVLGVSPRVSGQFETFGRAGRGKNVTIYANGKHVLMEINGHFWGTSASNPGGGAGWIPRDKISKDYLRGFVARHPAGM